ncbi:hypothetical protein HYY69_06505 [Candidatus Woesearchaeota archaeon]|nr:hypothetical protein [Candidatus Woesearchaeota archaeon]
MGKNSLEKIPWTKYLERKNAITYISIFNVAYGKLLEEATGFRFRKQLYRLDNNIVTFYRPSSELRQAKTFFSRLIQKNDHRISEWLNKAIEYEKAEEELIKQFADISNNEIINKHNNLFDKLQHIFLYLTVIPFMMLEAIQNEDNNDNEHNKQLILSFQSFRQKSRNPLHEQVLEKVWNIAGQISSLNYEELQYLTIDEISNIFNHKEFPTKEEITQRKQGCIFYEDEKTGKIIFNYDKKFGESIGLKKEIIPNINELNGTIACKGKGGKIQGTARIINKPYDMDKFKEGDIIISINTTPDLMPVLKKCKAIVTDEGGLTCHASIVSRELNKPCIVGTKYATKIFKDNDLIEVDVDNGTVRRV